MNGFYGYMRCSACGNLNRIAGDKINLVIKCGNCGKILEPYRSSLEINDNNFEKEVISWPGAVLVDFWSTTCVFCRQMMPIVQQVANNMAGLLKVVTVNTSSNPYTTLKYNIQGVPSFFIFKEGHLINKLGGALPGSQFEQWINQSIIRK